MSAEIEVDDRGRVSLKKAGVAPGRYRVTVEYNGSVRMDPVSSYTQAEVSALTDSHVRDKFSALQAGQLQTVQSQNRP